MPRKAYTKRMYVRKHKQALEINLCQIILIDFKWIVAMSVCLWCTTLR